MHYSKAKNRLKAGFDGRLLLIFQRLMKALLIRLRPQAWLNLALQSFCPVPTATINTPPTHKLNNPRVAAPQTTTVQPCGRTSRQALQS